MADGLIYSTAFGAMCPECSQPVKGCKCSENKKTVIPETDGIVRIRYEKAGRKGKGMTVISGLPLNTNALLELARKLKQKFGTGGAVKNSFIELQGDFCEKTVQELSSLGYTLQIAGK